MGDTWFNPAKCEWTSTNVARGANSPATGPIATQFASSAPNLGLLGRRNELRSGTLIEQPSVREVDLGAIRGQCWPQSGADLGPFQRLGASRVLCRGCPPDALPPRQEFVESSDAGLTAEERQREDLVEPAMLARLPAQARCYRRHLAGELPIEEAGLGSGGGGGRSAALQ